MNSLSATVTSYLATRVSVGPWEMEGSRKKGCNGVVVIPSLGESSLLFATLRSLAQQHPHILKQWLVLVVVNNRADALIEDKEDNSVTLQRLSQFACSEGLPHLAWIDASSPGKELPGSKGGVGMARKIGFDHALTRIDLECEYPCMVALDADTIVRQDYLESIERHFRTNRSGGAVIPFCHQEGSSPLQNSAIVSYELFLRSYVLGLSLAGSPYAFHTVGSAMACTVSAYIRMGGMNCRLAGEDFYFLQQLQKTSGIAGIAGTMVYPSARTSHRVPFGTGRTMTRLLGSADERVRFDQPACFRILGKWLELGSARVEYSHHYLMAAIRAISPCLGDFLDSQNVCEVLERLRRNNRSQVAYAGAFHCWFDALKSMKLIHFLANEFPRTGPEKVLPELLQWAGADLGDFSTAASLSWLRGQQNGSCGQPDTSRDRCRCCAGTS
jgi:hypothetical protein